MTETMVPLTDIATVVRSKNAGPHRLTLDIIFGDSATLEQVLRGGSLSPDKVAEIYGLTEKELSSWYIFRAGHALKFTFIRPIRQGSEGETDIYGAQQHAPLMSMSVTLA